MRLLTSIPSSSISVRSVILADEGLGTGTDCGVLCGEGEGEVDGEAKLDEAYCRRSLSKKIVSLVSPTDNLSNVALMSLLDRGLVSLLSGPPA